jgi:ethanolamine utilization cobalamin adenosyltransferase
LPIYITLYDLENKIVPDFDDKMNAVSEVAGVKYINLNNNEMKFMTHNENAYYDASHMVNSATEAFNKKLCSILKDNGFKTKARELTK